MKFSGKRNLKKSFSNKGQSSKPVVKTRRELRKEERRIKKTSKVKSYMRRVKKTREYYCSKKKTNTIRKDNEPKAKKVEHRDPSPSSGSDEPNKPVAKLTDLSKENRMIKDSHRKLKGEMEKQRKETLMQDNRKEDMIISKLEKQLNLKQRKSKSLPSSFTSAGLDYILDVCNPEKMKNLSESEKYLQDSGSEFEDDLAVVKGQSGKKNKKTSVGSESDGSSEGDSDVDSKSNKKLLKEEMEDNSSGDDDSLIGDLQGDMSGDESDDSDDYESMDEFTEINTYLNSKTSNNKSIKRAFSGSDSEDSEPPDERPVRKRSGAKVKKKSKVNMSHSEAEERKLDRLNSDEEVHEKSNDSVDDDQMSNEGGISQDDGGTWEDIYGRTRDRQGNIVQTNEGKYVPPALRAKAFCGDAKKRETLERLNRQLKGLLNRLAETNMHGIANQVEELYMKNSRNDMNQTLIALYEEAIVSRVLTPERLIMEHAMLTAILHANIGTEVGAHILQTFVTRFDSLLNEGTEIGDKRLDNLLAFICHLYTFKVFDNSLLYDILGTLCERFKEKEIDLILVVLRNSGFSLRKDDPLALKDLVLRVQKLANQASELKNDSRVKFMLDVLLKIKNNNMSKLPQYDPSHSEHLKKLIKSMVRKGSYITELKISLQDLLKADERGRWWIVGSAWTGPSDAERVATDQENSFQHLSLSQTMSEQLMKLARKLRINTDVRKNIFCILMTAEDFEDSIEKLLKLGLKNQSMNEIIHVVLHCLLQEKDYNHYYSLIANRFSQIDRKYRMVVQYSLWDKFKEVDNMKPFQITNLAKFLAFLFIEGTLPLSVLKVIQLVEMTKGNVRLIRQILLTILYNKDDIATGAVFLRLNKSPKLHLFREGLRLFLHHFLLKNVKETDEHYAFLKERISMADRALQPQL